MKKRFFKLIYSFLVVFSGELPLGFVYASDVTGIMKCVSRDEIAYVMQVANEVYVLILGDKTKGINTGKIVRGVFHVLFSGDVPSSNYRNCTYYGKGSI